MVLVAIVGLLATYVRNFPPEMLVPLGVGVALLIWQYTLLVRALHRK
jgi:hypothetical protein